MNIQDAVIQTVEENQSAVKVLQYHHELGKEDTNPVWQGLLEAVRAKMPKGMGCVLLEAALRKAVAEHIEVGTLGQLTGQPHNLGPVKAMTRGQEGWVYPAAFDEKTRTIHGHFAVYGVKPDVSCGSGRDYVPLMYIGANEWVHMQTGLPYDLKTDYTQ